MEADTGTGRAERIEQVIAELGLEGERGLWAALHLATPEQVNVHMSAKLEMHENHVVVSVRRRTALVKGEVLEVAKAGLALSQACFLEGDSFVDLDTEAWRWVRFVQSGSYFVGVGSAELLGVAVFAVDDEAGSSFCALPTRETGLLSLENGEVLLVDGDETKVVVHRAVSKTEEPPLVAKNAGHEFVAALGSELADLLHLEEGEFVILGSRVSGVIDVEYVFSTGEVEVIVPASIAANQSASVGALSGVAAGLVPDRIGASLGADRGGSVEVEGWTVIEPARFEPGVIAEHQESGIKALLRAV